VSRGAAKNTVTVKATGRTLSDVVPVAGALPVAAFVAGFAFSARRKEATQAPAETSAAAVAPAPIPTGRPLDVRGVYRRAKQKRAAP
jgi:hypothetical protein